MRRTRLGWKDLDDKGRTPLHTACGSGDLPTVRRLSAGLPLPAPSVADRLLPPAGPGLLLLPARAAGGGR